MTLFPKHHARSVAATLRAPLRDLRIATLAVNLPGPAAAARLRRLGARVQKIEPPGGDPFAAFCPAWYRQLCRGQNVITLDLRNPRHRRRLDRILARCDLLLTASRSSGLRRLGLGWNRLHRRFPKLCHVALVGHPAPRQNVPGHDLTFQARAGLLEPPQLPTALLADLAGAERLVSAALALLFLRERSGRSYYLEVALADAARDVAAPLRLGLTAPGGRLGGGAPEYNLYRARRGWIALAALEPHFWAKLQSELKLGKGTKRELAALFRTRAAEDWERWAACRDLPLVAVRHA